MEENLRIDLQEFEKLNQTFLLELATHYKSQSVKAFVRLIQKGSK